MKKSIILMVAGAAIMSACDPVEDSFNFDKTNYAADDLANAVTFKVYKDEACTVEAGPAEGNYITYTTSPATNVSILNDKGDVLAIGTSGNFKISPKRGASNDQPVIIRAVNNDNTVVETTKTVNVWVKSDLEPELKLLLGEAGKKSWMWDFNATTGATCWGNGGNAGSGDAYTARTVDGHWWGVPTPEDLVDQLAQSNTGVATGEESSGAYMTLDEDGNIVGYKADGTAITGRKGTFQLVDYNPARNNGWQVATLKTSDPAVLFPFSINEGGKTVTEFDVMYLDGNHMTLVYTKGNGAGSWGEITHWMFKNASPSTDLLEANGGKWSWATDGVEVWGNAGNSGNGAGFTYNAVDGKWWGVLSGDELSGQLGHAPGAAATGDESNDAYMVFQNSKVTSYAADGSAIRSAGYELEVYPDGRNGNWELGKLRTSDAGLLFPWSINEGGKAVTEFDIMYMDADNMTLVYTKGNGAGSWGEITYWRFSPKN